MIKNKVKEYLGDVNYFVTGSVRFGTNTDESDLDICVRVSDRDTLHNKADDPKESDYNNGFKVKCDDIDVNIIPLHPVDFVAWFHAAKLMEATPFLKEKSRAEIHGLYETYIGLIKSHFSYKIINNINCLEICNIVNVYNVETL